MRSRGSASAPKESEVRDSAEENPYDAARRVMAGQRSRTVDVISTKVHAAFWVALAVVAVVYLDFFPVLLKDARVNRPYLYAGLVFLGMQVGCVLYLTIYLRYIAKIMLEWEVYCPRVLYTSYGTGILAFIGFTVALWPVYGLLTVPFLLLTLTGLIMSLHFLPVW